MITPADLLAVLPPGPVIIEAGAHHGEDTVALAQSARHVYAFEPVPALHLKARELTDDHTNITLSSLALGGEQKMDKMWISSGVNDGSSSLLTPKEHATHYSHIGFDPDQLDVKVTTLDAWTELHGVNHVDGLWLDTQGAELSILQSAGKILQTVTAVMIEISLVELYEGCPLWPEVREWLNDQGFQPHSEYIYPGQYAGEVLLTRINGGIWTGSGATEDFVVAP